MKYPLISEYVRFKNLPEKSPFGIHPISWPEEDRGYENDVPQSSDYFQVIWIIKGNGRFYIDLQKFDFIDNQFLFIKPGQVYRLEPGDQLEGYVIFFTDSFLGFRNQGADLACYNDFFQTLACAIQIDTEIVADIKDCIDRIISEYNNVHLFRNEMLRRQLKILFIYLSRQLEGSVQTIRQTRNTELVRKFMLLLDKHFKTEKMVFGYASMLSVTPNYLNEIVKKITGYSAGHHIRQRVVLEAKRQATYSDNCMKQIGYYLGFNDMAHFSKFFKSATGMNFTDFKKEKMVVSIAS